MRRRFVTGAAQAGILFVVGIVFLVGGWSPRASAVTNTTVSLATMDPLVSGVSVQNLSSVNATVVIDFYNQSGSPVTSVSAVLGPNSQKTYYTPNVTGLPDGFIGSAVVSSDQPVAAIVNTQTPSTSGSDPSNPIRIGTSSGELSPAVKQYVPQIMRNYYGWSSTIYAQNTGGSSAVITATIVGADGLVKSVMTANVPAYSMKDFKQSDETVLGNGFVGSAIIQSTNPLAVVVNMLNSDATYTEAQFQSYNGISSGGTKLYVPRLVRHYYYEYNSGLKVQNLGASPTTVTVYYYIGSSNGVSQSATIGPGQAWGPYMGDDRQVPAGLSSGSGSAVITSSGQPIAAIVNEDNRLEGKGVTYNAIVDGTQTPTVFLPQVTSRYYGYASGIQFQNVGSVAASGWITLTQSGIAPITIPFSGLAPNTSLSFFAPNSPSVTSGPAGTLTNFNGSAVVHTSNGQPIVGIGNFSFRSDIDPRFGQKYGDSFTTYNALNQ